MASPPQLPHVDVKHVRACVRLTAYFRRYESASKLHPNTQTPQHIRGIVISPNLCTYSTSRALRWNQVYKYFLYVFSTTYWDRLSSSVLFWGLLFKTTVVSRVGADDVLIKKKTYIYWANPNLIWLIGDLVGARAVYTYTQILHGGYKETTTPLLRLPDFAITTHQAAPRVFTQRD